MDIKLKKWKPAVSFFAFMLGMSMLLGNVPQLISTLVTNSDDLFQTDYQTTAAFRHEISAYLRQFIGMGTGELAWEDVPWYDYEIYRDDGMAYTYYGSAVIGGVAWETNVAQGAASSETETPTPIEAGDQLHMFYQSDKNVLYEIRYQNQIVYTNIDGANEVSEKLYPFSMYFDGKKASATRNKRELDLYGDGYYQMDSEWNIPGYQNRQAKPEEQKVTVKLWAAKTPVWYSEPNGSAALNILYHLQRNLKWQTNAFYMQCIFSMLGIAFLGLYLRSPKEKALIDQKIARWTSKVPVEIKILVLLFAISKILLQATPIYWLREFIASGDIMLQYMSLETLQSLSAHTQWLVFVFWMLYLLANDWRYSRQSWKNAWILKLKQRAHALTMLLPIQKRMALLQQAAIIGAGVLFLLAVFSVYCEWRYGAEMKILVLPAVVSIGVAIWQMIAVCRNQQIAQDVGALVTQIEAVHSGDFTTPLFLPKDHDLAAAVEALNHIQAGMQEAVTEQLKSERMKVELITNVSHDIKTPLTAIISYIDLLKQEEALPAHVKDYIHVLDQKSQRLRTMVQDVVEVSKAASGQLPVQIEEIDLAKLLRQTLADMAEQIAASTVALRTEIPDTSVNIRADGGRVYRVFQNLIQNALQYSLPGSRIYVTLLQEEATAIASIKNISADELLSGADYTERFMRGDESRTDGGSGLGLSIAASFTEACGGDFHIETQADLFIAIVKFPL